MNTKNILALVVVVVLIGAGGWYFATHKSALSSTPAADTVATVNGEQITRAQLQASESQLTAGQTVSTSTEAQAQLQSQALDSLIAQKLLAQAAAHAGITASTTGIDAQLQSIKGQFATTDAYNQALAAQGMTEEQLRAQIATGLAIQMYLESTVHLSAVTATDAEIKAAYDQAAATQSGIPPLTEVRAQVEQLVIQQKQQQLIVSQVAQLRAAGDVKVLI